MSRRQQEQKQRNSKSKPPVCVTHESKLPVFQPTRRPSRVRQQRFDTAYGSVTVTGKLGQGHRDVLDAVMACAERSKVEDGRLSVLVDPYQLRKMVSSGRNGGMFPYDHIQRLLRDLRAAEVVMDMPALQLRVTDGILADFEESAITKESEPWAFQTMSGGPRPMLKVTFGKNWTRMLKKDLPVVYHLPIVIGMRHGASQATARYCLSHREVNDTLDRILVKIGYDSTGKTPRAVNKVKAEIRSDAKALAAVGVTITESGTVHRG